MVYKVYIIGNNGIRYKYYEIVPGSTAILSVGAGQWDGPCDGAVSDCDS